MEFRIEHTFAASIAEIEAAIFDGDGLVRRLAAEMDTLESIEIVSRRDDGDVVTRELRYRPRDRIPGFARRWVTPDMVSWVELSRYDRRANRFDYEIHPNIPESWRNHFDARGSYLLAAEGDGTRRVIDGSIVARAPVVRKLVERYLVGEVIRTFDDEAQILSRYLEDLRR